MAKLIRLKLYICDFYENLDQKTMEVIIHRALNGIAGSAMTDIFEIEEKAITWADDNPINQLNATQETWDEQFGSKDTQAARIAELEKMAEARKLANRLLEQERNELEVEYDRLREALKKIVALSTPDRVCNNCKHCQELGNTDWCGWNHKLLEDASSQECGKFEASGFIVPETHTIARKALEGAGDE
ncbi:MAG: hypothetical protein ACI406_08920 [Victivallis vadensis]